MMQRDEEPSIIMQNDHRKFVLNNEQRARSSTAANHTYTVASNQQQKTGSETKQVQTSNAHVQNQCVRQQPNGENEAAAAADSIIIHNNNNTSEEKRTCFCSSGGGHAELQQRREEDDNMHELSGRERLKRHRIEVAGQVWVPEIWGQEELLKDWIDCSAFDSSLVPNGIMSARAALVQQGIRRGNNPRRLRLENSY